MKKAMEILNEDFTESALEELAAERIEFDEENLIPEDAEQILADYGIATDQDCVCHVLKLSIETFNKIPSIANVLSKANDLVVELRTPAVVRYLKREKNECRSNHKARDGVFSLSASLISLA